MTGAETAGMPKASGWETALMAVASVPLGAVAFVSSRSIFDFFFVAFVVATLYGNSKKLSSIQKRLNEIEVKQNRGSPGGSDSEAGNL